MPYRRHAESISVKAGTTELDGYGDIYMGELKVIHEDYDTFEHENDIGLLKVRSDIIFNDDVQPINLASSDFYGDGHTATLTGWGRTSVR